MGKKQQKQKRTQRRYAGLPKEEAARGAQVAWRMPGRDAIAEQVEQAGYRLVTLDTTPGKIVIAAERQDGGISVGECNRLARRILRWLETFCADALPALEVSSPGIDRLLVSDSDFDAWRGHWVRLSLRAPLLGKRQWLVRLGKRAGERIFFHTGTEEKGVPSVFSITASDIEQARLDLESELRSRRDDAGQEGR